MIPVGPTLRTYLAAVTNSAYSLHTSPHAPFFLYMADTTYNALENTRTGESVRWVNPDTGHSGRVIPNQAFQTARGENCREFTQTVTIDGEASSAQGTACRQQDGTWRIVR